MSFKTNYKNMLSLTLGKGEIKSERTTNIPLHQIVLMRTLGKRRQNSSAEDLDPKSSSAG